MSHKVFFDELARDLKFNPADAKKWYSVDHDDIIKKRGGRQVIKHYGSYVSAIMAVYPELGLEKESFESSQKGTSSARLFCC